MNNITINVNLGVTEEPVKVGEVLKGILENIPEQVTKRSTPDIDKNEIIFDDAGKPSMMVWIPKFNLSDVIDGAPNTPHPAFIVDGKEIPGFYGSKYQNVIVDGNAYSLPFQEPAVNLNFDKAREACENKGKGWHIMTNAEWSAIALWSWKNGTLPRGNNDRGSDHEFCDENGTVYNNVKTLTGSGPNTWSHDHTQHGIFDLNGNIWEMVSGLRLVDGQIQIIPDNNAAKHIDQSADSDEWKKIIVDGESVKYTVEDGDVKVTTGRAKGWNGWRFSKLGADVEIPLMMKALGLFPADGMEETDRIYIDTEGERMSRRGGNWTNTSYAGVFYLNLGNPRSYSDTNIGFRSAYVEL